MKSLLAYDRASGRRAGIAGTGSDARSTFPLRLARVNQELWLVLSLFIIAGLMNWVVASRRRIGGFYPLPTLFSAYVYGRRHAVLTALASIFIVVVLMLTTTSLFASSTRAVSEYNQWAALVRCVGLLFF